MKNILKEKVRILRLEGAEILKNNKEGLNLEKDYKCVLDSSLLLNKLYNLKLDVKNGKTQDVVMLTFKYGWDSKEIKDLEKEIVKLKANKKANSTKIKELKEIRKQQANNLAKKPYTIEIEKLQADNADMRKKIDNKKDKIIKAVTDGKHMDKEEIRNYLYKNGFKIKFYKYDKATKKSTFDKEVEYTYFFRTSAKARVSNVFFIKKELKDAIEDWQTMGIKLPAENAKVVESEAYKSLTASALQDTIELKPDQILVVEDLKSVTNKMCNLIKTRPSLDREGNEILDADGNKILETYIDKDYYNVENVLFDGQALMDNSLFTESEGMKLLRGHYFKACAFRTKLQEFLSDYFGDEYETATITDKYNNNIKVANIKLITTTSAMKWEKFYDKDTLKDGYKLWKARTKADKNIFGVVKEDHKSKYGQMQRVSYQMLNSLVELDKNEVSEICEPTIDFIEEMKKNDVKFLEYLEMTKNDMNENEMIIDLYNKNPKFKDTKFYKKCKSKIISNYKKTLKEGKLLFCGDNLTVVGNPWLMLLWAVKDKTVTDKVINNVIYGYEDETLPLSQEYYSCYAKKFKDEEELAGFRNPHNAPHNIAYLKNYIHPYMEYFNFSDNIIAVNMLENDIQDRCNGMDMDSDFIYTTNNSKIVNCARESLKYNTIVNLVKQDKKTYNNTLEARAEIDNALARGKNDIGVSSNIAQLALTWWQEDKNNAELEEVVCIASVLAQIAIDNAKRKYVIDVNREVARLNSLPSMAQYGSHKPYFWQYIKEVKEKELTKQEKQDLRSKEKEIATDMSEEEIKKIEYKNKAIQKAKDKKVANAEKAKEKKEKLIDKCLTRKISVMDYVEMELDNISDNWNNNKGIELVDLINTTDGKGNDKQIKKIENLIEELDNLYKKHYAEAENEDADDETWKIESTLKTMEVMEQIGKYKLDRKTMERLICKSICNNNKKYQLKMLKALYFTNQELFLDVFSLKNT